MTWLSHHPPEELDRTWHLGGRHVCARCLGLYPVLVGGIALQVLLATPLRLPLEGLWGVVLALPAILDWGYGRLRPHAGTNAWRTLTGVLLGVALARSLYVHFQRPWPPLLLTQLVLVTAVAAPVIVFGLLRRGPN